ncbi:MAG: NosD domain-containing protein [Desulfurococcaceae archaeon]
MYLIVLQSFSPTASARTIIVPTNYPDIQSAINAASSGDVITVFDGVYRGFKVTKSVVILGSSPNDVIINGTVEIYASNVRLSSMKIVLNTSDPKSSAIMVFGQDVLLGNLVIESGGYGVYVGNVSYTNSTLNIEYTTINASSGGIGGLISSLHVYLSTIKTVKGRGIEGATYLELQNSTVLTSSESPAIVTRFGGRASISYSELSSNGPAVYLSSSRDSVVVNNKLVGDVGIYLDHGASNYLFKNIILSNSIGIHVLNSKGNLIEGNTISSRQYSIRLQGGDENIISYNELSGGRGVETGPAYRNTIAFNFINRTGSIGIFMSKYTGGNVIYGNTFWHCYNYNAADESGENLWYFENETSKVGNYWYDHTSPDSNSDGIVDVPYYIATTLDKKIIDKYPLAKPIFYPMLTPSPTTSPPLTTPIQTPTPTTSITLTTSAQTSSPAYTTTTPVSSGESLPIYLVLAPLALIIALVLFLKFRR